MSSEVQYDAISFNRPKINVYAYEKVKCDRNRSKFHGKLIETHCWYLTFSTFINNQWNIKSIKLILTPSQAKCGWKKYDHVQNLIVRASFIKWEKKVLVAHFRTSQFEKSNFDRSSFVAFNVYLYISSNFNLFIHIWLHTIACIPGNISSILG